MDPDVCYEDLLHKSVSWAWHEYAIALWPHLILIVTAQLRAAPSAGMKPADWLWVVVAFHELELYSPLAIWIFSCPLCWVRRMKRV